jgi:hypothetical protein
MDLPEERALRTHIPMPGSEYVCSVSWIFSSICRQNCEALAADPEDIGAARSPTRRREELCPAVQGLLANRPVMDVLGIFGRLAQGKVDPGCCQLPVVSVRRSRLEWGIWT